MASEWYLKKLNDVRWQKKRLEMFSRDEWACRICNKTIDMSVQLHHKGYIKGRDPWDYSDIWFISVCDECHDMIKNRNSPKIKVVDNSKAALRFTQNLKKYAEYISKNKTDQSIIEHDLKVLSDYFRLSFMGHETKRLNEMYEKLMPDIIIIRGKLK